MTEPDEWVELAFGYDKDSMCPFTGLRRLRS